MAELLWKSFRDSKDTTLKSVSYSLLVMQDGDNAERALTASWVSEALYDAIMTKYGRVGPDAVDGHAVLQVLDDTTKAAYIVYTSSIFISSNNSNIFAACFSSPSIEQRVKVGKFTRIRLQQGRLPSW
jgi:hypothetical protein